MNPKAIRVLENSILAHRALYDAGKPEISDEAFDKLVDQLQAVKPNSPALSHLGKATSGAKITHTTPMLSLDKVYEVPDLARWYQRVSADRLIVQPKYDGLAISLVYFAGKLMAAGTRGDGAEGDDITSTIKWAAQVYPDTGLLQEFEELHDQEAVVRGELLIPLETFKTKYASTYANPRNLVAGLAHRKAQTAELGDVRFVAYDIHAPSLKTVSLFTKLSILEHLGFETGRWETCKTFDTLHPLVTADWRSRVPFELDGVVVKVDSAEQREKLGETAHHPIWAIAWKYQGESGTTTLRDVEWSLSRTGVITPVAIMDPVELSGASITRATLHNAATFVDFTPRVGAKLVVTRRGGVIPHVESVQNVPLGERLVIPTRCPACSSAVAWHGATGSKVDIVCTNVENCSGVRRAQILYWCKTTGMLGIGPETIEKLMEHCGVFSIADLYTLKVKTLRDAGFGPRQAEIILEEVEKTTTLTDTTFLEALGLPGVGVVTAEKIATDFDWETLTLKGSPVGRRYKLEASLANLKPEIDKILVRVRVERREAPAVYDGAATPFTGKKVVFTGPLSDMERTVAQDLVRSYGGTAPPSLVKDTDFLVVGDRASPSQLSKRSKAESFNKKGAKIRVISESDFIAMLAEADHIANQS